MTACPSTRSEVWGALANVLASYLSTPRQFFGPVIKVQPAAIGRGRMMDCRLWTDAECEEYVHLRFRGGDSGGSKARTAWRFHHLHSSNNAGECVLHS
jgi:hypothetical protein